MSLFRVAARTSFLSRQAFRVSRPTTQLPLRAAYSAAAGLNKEDIQTRVLDVLKGFEKVDQSKVRVLPLCASCYPNSAFLQLTPSASFSKEAWIFGMDFTEPVGSFCRDSVGIG